MAGLTNRFVLRPLDLKQVFDFTLRIYRASFAQMFLAMAIVQLPLTLMMLPVWIKFLEINKFLSSATMMGGDSMQDYFLNDLDSYLILAGLMLAGALFQLLVWPLGALTCSKIAMQTILNERWTFAEAFQHSRQRYWPTQVALATFVFPLLVLALLVLVPVLIFSMADNEAGIISSALIGISLIPLGMFVTLIFFFRLYPALSGAVQSLEAAEGKGMLSRGIWYLKRAWQLTSGHWLRSIGFFVLLYFAINFISRGMTESVSLIILLVQMITAGDFQGGTVINSLEMANTDPLLNGLSLVIASLIGIFIAPIWQAFSVSMYADLKCRKEGMDLQMLLESLPQPIAASSESRQGQ